MAFTVRNKWTQWQPANLPEWFFWIFSAVVLLSLFIGVAMEMYFLAVIPLMLLLVFMTIVDFKVIFWFLIACIPLSTEITLPNGFGTDLPTEPLMVGLMIVYFLYAAQRAPTAQTARFMRHPITLILLAHIGWIVFTTLTSSLLLVSVKFTLAKIWYVIVFYFMAGSLIVSEREVRRFFWVLFIPLVFTVAVVFLRHGLTGFTFKDIHTVLHPFYRNHVSYAATLALFAPLLWLAIGWHERGSNRRRLLIFTAVFVLGATYLSYTRAAYFAILIAVGAYYVIRLKLTRHAIAVSLVAGIGIIAFFAYRNHYLSYAPNYDRTVAHEQFDNLIEATYKMEDISTMERVYRWIAGFYMSKEDPLVGFGPGNFVNFYKSYTVTSFQTYVSDNPEQSGIHSYYILTLVEQGIPGLLLFLLLSFYTLVRGEQIYHRLTDPHQKRIVMTALLCLIVIHSFLIINDMIETDKVGTFFFLYTAIIVNAETRWLKAPE